MSTIAEPPDMGHLLLERIMQHPRAVHHRLPKSRGGTTAGNNTTQINRLSDDDWHALFNDMVGKEIGHQLSIWKKRGLIFAGHDFIRIECKNVTEETRWRKPWRDKHKIEGSRIRFDMSEKEKLAWKYLFCVGDVEASPKTALRIMNDVFLHPDTPLILIEPEPKPEPQAKKPKGGFLRFWQRR